MGQEIPKQFLHIHDKPVIIYTMERFQFAPEVDEIYVATLPGWASFVETYARQFGITKLKGVVPGGATGHESIHNGLVEIAKSHPGDTAVMIHDGNRPMVDLSIIAENLDVFRKKGNATTVIPCVEVAFKSDSSTEATEMLDRSKLWRTQTPHTYRLDKLLWAHAEVSRRGLPPPVATCHLMAALGETVYFSRGSEKNIKLTTVDDMDIFSALLTTERLGWKK